MERTTKVQEVLLRHGEENYVVASSRDHRGNRSDDVPLAGAAGGKAGMTVWPIGAKGNRHSEPAPRISFTRSSSFPRMLGSGNALRAEAIAHACSFASLVPAA
jgi:hypothetical protein